MTKIVEDGLDPGDNLLYNPVGWAFANNTPFSADFNWLAQPVRSVINGRPDAFSLRYVEWKILSDFDQSYIYVSSNLPYSGAYWLLSRMRDICQPFDQTPPDAPLFDTKKVAIVSNGRYIGFFRR